MQLTGLEFKANEVQFLVKKLNLRFSEICSARLHTPVHRLAPFPRSPLQCVRAERVHVSHKTLEMPAMGIAQVAGINFGECWSSVFLKKLNSYVFTVCSVHLHTPVHRLAPMAHSAIQGVSADRAHKSRSTQRMSATSVVQVTGINFGKLEFTFLSKNRSLIFSDIRSAHLRTPFYRDLWIFQSSLQCLSADRALASAAQSAEQNPAVGRSAVRILKKINSNSFEHLLHLHKLHRQLCFPRTHAALSPTYGDASSLRISLHNFSWRIFVICGTVVESLPFMVVISEVWGLVAKCTHGKRRALAACFWHLNNGAECNEALSVTISVLYFQLYLNPLRYATQTFSAQKRQIRSSCVVVPVLQWHEIFNCSMCKYAL